MSAAGGVIDTTGQKYLLFDPLSDYNKPHINTLMLFSSHSRSNLDARRHASVFPDPAGYPTAASKETYGVDAVWV